MQRASITGRLATKIQRAGRGYVRPYVFKATASAAFEPTGAPRN